MRWVTAFLVGAALVGSGSGPENPNLTAFDLSLL